MDGFPDFGSGKTKPPPHPQKLNIINPKDLAGMTIPTRQWIIDGWLPIGCTTALYGDGGVGKTLLAQQLMTSTAINVPWCGLEVSQVRSFGYFCEDDEDELHRRQAEICAAYGRTLADAEAMRWASGVGNDNTLMAFDFEGAWATPLYEAIKQGAQDHGAQLVVLDTAADLFSGNENDRHQVRRFIGQCNRLAIDLGAAVLLNAHPSRSGLASGNLDGGSTGWNNSVRSRWTLGRVTGEDGKEEDTSARVLTKRKANYSSIGDSIDLQWSHGVLTPSRGLAGGFGAADRLAADIVFLELLEARWRQNVFVSHNNRAGNYAPKVFGRSAERRGYSVKDFEAAMGRLFDCRRIIAEPYGRSGDARQRIALVREADGGGLDGR